MTTAQASSRPPAWLAGSDVEGEPQRWLLEAPTFLIGRRAPADLVLPLPLVSRQHAQIDRGPLAYSIRDLGSRNGTFIEGQRLGKTARELVSGDEIVIAGAFAFHFVDPDETLEGPRIGKLEGLWLDHEAQAVWVDAQRLEPPLSAAQFDLLALLAERDGAVVSREEIVAAIWPEEEPAGVSEQAVEALVKRLRGRLRDLGPSELRIETLRGRGLRLIGG